MLVFNKAWHLCAPEAVALPHGTVVMWPPRYDQPGDMLEGIRKGWCGRRESNPDGVSPTGF